MRVWLLRALMTWWMVPFVWLMVWPIAYLTFGAADATKTTVSLTRHLWTGKMD